MVLGVFGDRAGRRPAMMLSFLLMCVGVLGLAVTPSYAQIGVAAPMGRPTKPTPKVISDRMRVSV